jgi:carbon monoxide dehydrogenase subunit G
MEFKGEYRIPAPQQAVWDALNDPEVLRRSLPGCKALEQTGANEFTATIAAKIGPVSATFKGKVDLIDLDPPNGYTLSGRGQGGPAGFAKGSARVSLKPDGDATLLHYVATVDIGGKLAGVGSRLIGGVAASMAEEFFGKFSRVLTAGANDEGAGGEMPEPGSRLQPQPQTQTAVVAGGFPLIDRFAWLAAGFGGGIVATLVYLGRL